MPCKKTKGNPKRKGKKHKKHTPIVSEKQRGLFGAELARRKAGKQRRMKGITTAELRRHLKETKGKKLPEKAKKRKKVAKKRKKRKKRKKKGNPIGFIPFNHREPKTGKLRKKIREYL